MYNDHKPGRELDDTAASSAHDRLEEILRRVKAAGADINKDEMTPLFDEFNNDTVEIGQRRVVEFNFNKTDFQITRDVKTARSTGGVNGKHLEKIARPMVETKLKKKPENEDVWVGVDFEDMF